MLAPGGQSEVQAMIQQFPYRQQIRGKLIQTLAPQICIWMVKKKNNNNNDPTLTNTTVSFLLKIVYSITYVKGNCAPLIIIHSLFTLK